MNDNQTSSTHIGSLPCVPGKSGRQVHPLVPDRSVVIWPPSVAAQSMIVAAAEIEAGAAFMALAIFCPLVICACALTTIGSSTAITRSTAIRLIRFLLSGDSGFNISPEPQLSSSGQG